MSKELIEKLQAAAVEFGSGSLGELMRQAADALEAKAAPVGELWAVHAQGPDDIYPAFSRDDAERHAAELNALPMPEGIAVSAVVIQSPLPAAEHWKCLAEQEREQCEAIQAGAAYQRAQQPQSAEVVAYWDVERSLVHMACEPFNQYEKESMVHCRPLYTTPQPSAGVVMPARLRGAISMVLTALDRDALNGRPARGEMATELRDAIDEFARLNGKEVGRE